MSITFNKCPECGSDRIQLETGDFREPDGRLVRNLERWVCPECGAIFYDPTAMRRIEEARKSRKNHAKALTV